MTQVLAGSASKAATLTEVTALLALPGCRAFQELVPLAVCAYHDAPSRSRVDRRSGVGRWRRVRLGCRVRPAIAITIAIAAATVDAGIAAVIVVWICRSILVLPGVLAYLTAGEQRERDQRERGDSAERAHGSL